VYHFICSFSTAVVLTSCSAAVIHSSASRGVFLSSRYGSNLRTELYTAIWDQICTHIWRMQMHFLAWAACVLGDQGCTLLAAGALRLKNSEA
jgi:hypothetical protein